MILQYNQPRVGMMRPNVRPASRAAGMEQVNPVSSSAAKRLLSCALGFSAVMALLVACGAPRATPSRVPPTQAALSIPRATTVPTSTPAPAVPDPTRVLFVGNSLTFVNDLPKVFAELAWTAGHSVEVEMSAQGGQTLANHATSPSTLEKITDQSWNFVVLQEQSKIPAIAALRSEQMVPAVRLLDGKITENGAGTVLFLTWAGRDGLPGAGYEDYAAMQAGIEAGYLEVAGEIGALVAPAGVAWQRALEGDPRLELWQRDGIHPSPEGTYLAACVFYATLLGQSPEGASYLAGLPEETARFLQSVAAETVLGDPERWNMP